MKEKISFRMYFLFFTGNEKTKRSSPLLLLHFGLAVWIYYKDKNNLNQIW